MKHGRPTASTVGALVAAFVALGAAALWLASHEYVNDYALSRWAKVLAVLGLGEAGLEDFGLVYPHFFVYGLLPFRALPGLDVAAAPVILSVLAGAGLLALWHHHLRLKGYGPTSRMLLLLLVGLHPFFLWAATSGTQAALSLLVFYLLYMSVDRMLNEQDVRSFIMLGLVFAVFFFLDERAYYLYLAILPMIPFVTPRRIFQESPVSVYLLLSLPLLIAVAAWVYLNWIFADDPLAFIASPDSAFAGAWQDAPHVAWLREYGGRWWASLLMAAAALLVACPVLVPLWMMARAHRLLLVGVAVILGHPLLATAIASDQFFLVHPVHMLFFAMAGIMGAIVLLPRESARRRRSLYATLALGILGGWLVFGWLPSDEMRRWTQALRGERIEDLYLEDRRLGAWLDANRRPTLIDDRLAYRAIVARGDAEQLILPFSDAFKLALMQREPGIEQIVVPNPDLGQGRADLINQRYPRLFDQGARGYERVFDSPRWRVYRLRRLALAR